MTLLGFARLLAYAGALDERTAPERRPALLAAGWIFMAAAAISAALDLGGCITAVAAVAGAICLFFYAMAAKLYGLVAIGSLVAFIGVCWLIVGTGRTQDVAAAPVATAPIAAPPALDSAPIRVPPPDPVVAAPPPPPPATAAVVEPAVPPARLMVFIDQRTRTYFRADCAHPARAQRVLRSVALMQGYRPDAECYGH